MAPRARNRWGGLALLLALRTQYRPRVGSRGGVGLMLTLVGLAWLLFASDSRPVEGNPEAFLVMRTVFGAAWLPLALIPMTDRGGEVVTSDRIADPVEQEVGRP
jgi:hypothetical protein